VVLVLKLGQALKRYFAGISVPICPPTKPKEPVSLSRTNGKMSVIKWRKLYKKGLQTQSGLVPLNSRRERATLNIMGITTPEQPKQGDTSTKNGDWRYCSVIILLVKIAAKRGADLLPTM
jgi:hypothetical protein